MLQRPTYTYVAIVILAILSIWSPLVTAQQVNISATVPAQPTPPEQKGTVIFSGLAYPGSTVTIFRAGTALGAITADTQAQFSFSFSVDPGSATYSVVGRDAAGRESNLASYTLTLTAGMTATVSGIFLGPTIAIDRAAVSAGDSIIFSGTTAPSSTVSVYVTPNIQGAFAAAGGGGTYTITAGSNGSWTQTVTTTGFSPGSYTARARATSPSSSVSDYSVSVGFSVGAPDVCAGAVPGDINCDTKVDLVDFSILLFYWNTSNPANARADINTDGIVDVIDFSILLYYWTG